MFDKAILLDPKYVNAYFNKGIIYIMFRLFIRQLKKILRCN